MLSDTLLSAVACLTRSPGLHWPQPITAFLSLAFSFSVPRSSSILPLLSVNVFIIQPMCKLFSPALRADGGAEAMDMWFSMHELYNQLWCNTILLVLIDIRGKDLSNAQLSINMHAVSCEYWLQWEWWLSSLYELTLQNWHGLMHKMLHTAWAHSLEIENRRIIWPRWHISTSSQQKANHNEYKCKRMLTHK